MSRQRQEGRQRSGRHVARQARRGKANARPPWFAKLVFEPLEARELLWSSGGNAAIAISSDSVPEGVPEIDLVTWTGFGPQGGQISYNPNGGTAQPGRDIPNAGGSVSVGSSGSMLLVIPTLPDDAKPDDFNEDFSEAVQVYTPGYGQPSAGGADIISEGGPSSPVVSNSVCDCGNVEARVNPASGASIVSFGDGDPTEAMNYNSLDSSRPIVTIDDTLSSTVGSASDVRIYTVLTDLAGDVLWTGPTSTYSPSGYTQGEQLQFSQQITPPAGLAAGVYAATTFVIEDYATSAPIMRGYGQFVAIDETSGPLGQGWRLNDVDRLLPQSNSNTAGVGLEDGAGNISWFNRESANGSYDVPDNRTDIASLVQNGDQSYTITYRNGERENFTSAGQLTSRVDRDNNETTFSWNPDGTLASITAQSGKTTSYSYSGGFLTGITDFAGRVMGLQVTGGELTQVTRPAPGNGETTPVATLAYSGTLLTGITDSGGTTTIAYNSLDQATKITNPDSTYSSYTVPAGQSMVNAATVGGTVTNEDNQTSSYSVNSYGETTVSTDAAGTLQTTTVYNSAGLPTQITKHPLTGSLPDQVTKFFHDANNNLDEEDFPDGTKSTWVYNQTWNEPTQYVDPAGRETDYGLDSTNGNVLTVTQVSHTQGVANRTTQYTYTPDPTAQGQTPGGLVATTVDPRGTESDDAYNTHGLLTQEVFAKGTSDQASVEYTYDQNDNEASFENELGAITLTTDDNLNRLVERQLPAPDPNQPNVRPTTTWTYDPRSNLLQMVDPRGLVTTYTPSVGSDGDNQQNDKITQPDPAGGTNYTVTTFGHDNAGNLTSITSPAADLESIVYDADGRPTSDQQPNPVGGGTGGPISSVVYDPFSNAAQTFDAASNETDNTFNWRGQVLTTTGPAPTQGASRPTITETYNADGQVLTSQDARGNITQYFYDDFGELIKEILPDPDGSGPLTSPVLQWSYDADGNQIGFTDANGHSYQYQFGPRNELLKEIDPSPDGVAPSPTTTYVYDVALEQTQVTDPQSRVTQRQFNPDGWLIATIAPNLSTGGAGDATTTTTDSYDLDGNLVSQQTPNGGVTTWTLDGLNRVTQETDPVPGTGGAAPVWQYSYNADSVLTKTVDPLNRAQTTTLDGMDRPSSQTSFTGVPTAWNYNNLSEVLTTTVGTGSGAETTTNTWDALGNKTSIQNAAGTTTMAFDLAGNMTSLTDGDQNKTSWVFDNLNRATSETNQLGYSRLFSYDSNSNLVQETDMDGRVRDFTVDNLNRRTAETWMNGGTAVNTIATGYNADGQITTAGDSYSNYALSYDGQGNLTGVNNSGTPGVPQVTLASVYDTQGERTSLAASVAGVSDFINSYGYDKLSQMIMVQQQQQQTGGNTVAPKEVDLTYDALGDLTSRVGYGFIGIGPRTDVTTGTFSYNTLGQLTSLKYTSDAGANTIDQFGWTYNPLGQVATFTSNDGTATYGYDNTSQLVSATYTGTNQPANESYTLDANGNRAATGMVVSTNNQVTNDGTFTYTFDHEGNRLTRTRISGAQANDYLTTYSWDYRNRLTDVYFYNNSNTLTQHLHYTYDVFNNLISRSVDATGSGSYSEIDYFVYDLGAPNTAADRAVLEFIDPDGAGPDPAALAERYLIGPDVAGLIDQVYAQENVLTGATTWLLSDNLGSTRDTVDANGALTGHFNYNSFGQLVSGPTNITPFLFTGEYTDPATHLQFNAARWFDPATGTWLSPDPADFGPGDANLTRYVLNQPTTFIDPSGLQAMRNTSGAPLVYPQAAAGTPAATDSVFQILGNDAELSDDPPIVGGGGDGGGDGGGEIIPIEHKPGQPSLRPPPIPDLSGATIHISPNGQVYYTWPNGDMFYQQGGANHTSYANGSHLTEYPGGISYFVPPPGSGGKPFVKFPNGNKYPVGEFIKGPNGSTIKVVNKEGVIHVDQPNGPGYYVWPDGQKSLFGPKTGGKKDPPKSNKGPGVQSNLTNRKTPPDAKTPDYTLWLVWQQWFGPGAEPEEKPDLEAPEIGENPTCSGNGGR